MEPTTLLPIGLGLIVIGAAMGIGKFATAAAESIARQPEAADKITGAINLPLFPDSIVANLSLCLFKSFQDLIPYFSAAYLGIK